MEPTTESIQAEARAALDLFDRNGTMPVNPYPAGSDFATAWIDEICRYGAEVAVQ